jgi:hypothetical protein
MSKREALIDIISMAQHARPKAMGQIEFLRPQLITLSSVVVITPARNAACSIVSISTRENNSAGPLAMGPLPAGKITGELIGSFLHDDRHAPLPEAELIADSCFQQPVKSSPPAPAQIPLPFGGVAFTLRDLP